MQDLQNLFQLIKDDFSIFVEEIIGLENEEFHNEIDSVLSNEAYKKIVISISRGHGKSTHLSVAYPLWEIAKNHNLRILIVSSTATIADGFLTQILNHIEQNEKYADWARWVDPTHTGVRPKKREINRREEKWSGNAITIERDDLNLKDSSIQAIGLFGSILSKRADIVIVDDLVNQQNSETEDQRQKIKDWVYTTLMPIIVPGGKFIYLGNTWHQDDLVASLLSNPQFHYRKKMPAIISESNYPDLWNQYADIYLNDEINIEEKNSLGTAFYEANKELMDDGVKVLWPRMYPYKDLYLKRLENSYSFSRMYQCDPSQRPNQKILDIWIQKALDRGKDLMLQDSPRTDLIMTDTTGGLDLAISQKATADDTVFVTLDQVRVGNGFIQPGDYILRNITRGKFTPNQVREMVEEKYNTIKHSGIRVETVAYQESMRRDLADRSIPVKGHQTGGEKNDPDIGINSLAIILEQGKLVLPFSRSDARTQDLVSKLINEMRTWPEGHTGDSLMALWFAYLEMRDHRGRGFTAPRTAYIPDNIKVEGKTMEEINRELDRIAIQKSENLRAGVDFHRDYIPASEDSSAQRKFSF